MKKYSNIDITGSLNLLGGMNSGEEVQMTASMATTASYAETSKIEYHSMYLPVSQDNVQIGVDVNFVVDNGRTKNMTYSGNTVTLKAGVTYELNTVIRTYSFSNTTGGFADFILVDSSNNPLGWSSAAATAPPSNTNQFSTNSTIIGIIKPTSDVTIKLRCVLGNGTCSVDSNGTRMTVRAIDFS